jgi:antitoxin CptB
MIGGFFDRHHAAWNEGGIAWFEALLDEDDVDIMAWALGSARAPEKFMASC